MRAVSMIDWSSFINGTQVSGFEEGDGVVTFEWLGKASASVGADGRMQVNLTANRSCKIGLTLQHTSDQNSFLQKMWNLQMAGPRKFLPIVYAAKDSYRQDTVAGWFGIITNAAKHERGEKAGKMTWEITCERGVLSLGKPDFTGLLSQAAEFVGPISP